MSKLREKLQYVIMRDLNIDVELPEEVNRGYWSICKGSDVTRWMCKSKDGNLTIESPDSMTKCVKNGVSILYPKYRASFEPVVYAKSREVELND